MLSTVSSTTGTTDAVDGEIKILFPEIVQQKINTVEFLAAARGVARIVDKLGKVFAPVKYDIQGNIDKLTARYATNMEQNVTLQDMILFEKATETKLIAMDALLWLTRGLHMILLFFEKIVEDGKTDSPTEDLVAFLKKSYKEALEPYHGWMAQQLFDILSRMVPTRLQLLSALSTSENPDKHDIVLRDMEIYLTNLRKNVSIIQMFYKTHNLGNAR
ncbi:pleckstrin homology domain-containing family A member 8 [Megalopta genalis]|uniref:pleckstrin homology domain-containing family A member 8 n=1 Tax=Megalopta genalis TaxID=115081 RepID=UPI0014430CE7|nr:pleckstrin homology domain-containing family A member 8 [Megalopta genalis]XP_033339408.1 pleckstrin homology domain-containing family A member 8 [Megalopta genalis]